MSKRLIILAAPLLVAALVALVAGPLASPALAQGYGYWWFDYYCWCWQWYDPNAWPNYGGGEGANACGVAADATWYGQPC